MKILALRFENLNSLKGNFFIDFQNPAFQDGLFAITGNTGSGKSTILDSITLAIYGFIPRLGGEVTITDISQLGGVVTHGEKQSFAEIDYEVKGKVYRSNWSINLNRNGNWNAPKLSLSKKTDLGFESLVTGITKTREKNQEIIGLDGLQFTQSIVLSQGKFDQFLKANPAEKYKLLELLTGTSDYRKIGKLAHKRATDLGGELETLMTQLGEIELLTEEGKAFLEIEIDTLTRKGKVKKLEIDELSKHIKGKEDLEKSNAILKKLEEEFASIEVQIEEFEPTLSKKIEHEKASEFAVPLNNLTNLNNQIKDLEKDVEATEQKLDAQQKIKTSLIAELYLQCKLTVDEVNALSELNRFTKSVSKLESQINAKLTTQQAKKDQFESIVNEQLKSDDQKEKAIAASNYSELVTWLDTEKSKLLNYKLPKEINQLDLLNEFIHHKEDGDRLSTIVNNKKELTRLLELVNTFTSEIVSYQKIQGELIAIIESSTLEFNKKNEALIVLQKIQGMEHFRSQLVAGEPCPCCGSLDHPYSQALPKVNAQLELDVKDLELLISGSEKKKLEIDKKIVEVKANIKASKITIESLEKKVGVEYINIPTDNLEAELQELNILTNSIKVNLEAKSLISPLESLVELKTEMDRIAKEIEVEQAKKRELFSGEDIQNFEIKFSRNWESAKSSHATFYKLLTSQKSDLEKKSSLYKDRKEELLKLIYEKGFDGIEILSEKILKSDELEIITKKSKKLLEDKNVKDGQITQIKTQIKSLLKSDTDPRNLLELREEHKSVNDYLESVNQSLGSHRRELEDNKKRSERDQALRELKDQKQLQFDLHSKLSNIIGDSSGNRFNAMVQRYAMVYLFELANERLKGSGNSRGLMDRYQLSFGGTETPDQVWVIDTHMGNVRRTADAISGGERFVISLALALALSDLASENVLIETMFIDEGFGSLSSEDLDNAITTLERLQVEGGKMVGLISHVDSLKERISTQIQVKKSQNGLSSISLKSFTGEVSLQNV
jgi:exonuclease SbcC